jgi:hypothetical protein
MNPSPSSCATTNSPQIPAEAINKRV